MNVERKRKLSIWSQSLLIQGRFQQVGYGFWGPFVEVAIPSDSGQVSTLKRRWKHEAHEAEVAIPSDSGQVSTKIKKEVEA